MKRYLVKETSTATESNPNYAGDVSICYFGKAEHMLAREGTHLPKDNFNHFHFTLAEYGYSRKCDAKRSYTYKHPENTKFWTSTVEIVEVDSE